MSSGKLLNSCTLADKLLFASLLFLSIAGILFVKEALPENRTVRVDVDGKPVYALPLDRDRVISVEGPEGRTSIQIKGGRVRIADSPCPNKFCVRQGWVESGGIVCLPNKVVVTVGGRQMEKREVDAITG